MARVVILGGGFAAVAAAEQLAAHAGAGHEIVLVSKTSEFTFFPAIVPMVFSDMRPHEIMFDLRAPLAARNIQFLQGEVHSIDVERRTVEVLGKRFSCAVGFDYLLVAVGRRLALDAVPGLKQNAYHLLDVENALRFKDAISAFGTGSIVVGLCPDAALPVPVCETALGLAERFAADVRRGRVSITVAVPTTLEKAFVGSALFRDIEGEFDRKGIRLVSDFAVSGVDAGRIYSALGDSIKHDLLMLVPPFAGRLSLKSLGPVTDVSGFAKVNPLMQVDDLDRIYAAGDIVSVPGPKFGYMAMRQARVAAANILAELRGETPATEYVHRIAWAIAEKYTDPVFFHYGFWDESLEDFDEDVLFGMAKAVRERYGPLLTSNDRLRVAA